MYLDAVTDFEPKNGNYYGDTTFGVKGLPSMKSNSRLMVYFEYYDSSQKINSLLTKLFKNIDEKIDDGKYGSDKFRTNCKG